MIVSSKEDGYQARRGAAASTSPSVQAASGRRDPSSRASREIGPRVRGTRRRDPGEGLRRGEWHEVGPAGAIVHRDTRDRPALSWKRGVNATSGGVGRRLHRSAPLSYQRRMKATMSSRTATASTLRSKPAASPIATANNTLATAPASHAASWISRALVPIAIAAMTTE